MPQRYFDFLKFKDLTLLEDILRHNAQDIAGLARLLYVLAGLHLQPETAHYAQDLYSLGRIHEKRGLITTARKCYKAADSGAISALSRARLALTYQKEGEWQQAAGLWQLMIRAHQGGAEPYIALAKLQEHRFHDPTAAAATVRSALVYMTDQPSTDKNKQLFDDLTRRYHRLLHTISHQTV